MTTLFDVTLDLARHIRGVKRHKISAVSNSGHTLQSPTMENLTGEYVRGTVWIMTGECKGKVGTILRANSQTLTIAETDVYADVGDIIMVCPWIDFTLSDLIDAINSVLYHYPILAMDDSLTWDSDVQAYQLPEDVSDIRRVQVENSEDNGTYVISHCWLEDKDGFIRFHTSQSKYKDGGKMQIYHRKMHGDVYEAEDEIHPMVDLVYLRNLAMLYLWRNVIIHQHKDNPISADMFNEAKMYEAEHQKFNLPERNIMIRDLYVR